jgi:hypothetical protein
MLRVQTVIDMIVDKGTLGVDDGLFDRLQLMSDIQAGLSCLDHFYHRPQVAVGAFQPGNESGVACVNMRI